MRYFIFIFSLMLGISVSGQDYVLVWSDEFNEPGLPDSTHWRHEVGMLRNSELQYFTYKRLENSRIEDSVLIIELHKEQIADADYSSASLISKTRGDWKYGKVEIRAKVPTGKGTWPALWMMPTYSVYGTWPRSGEIDIMEYIGVEPENLFFTAHFEGIGGSGHSSSGSGRINAIEHPWERFLTYTLCWTPDSLEWYVDGVKYHSYVKPANDPRLWPFDQEFYMIMNLSYGGNWGGYDGVDDTKLPHQFLIDYIRVYKQKEHEAPYTVDILQSDGGFASHIPELDEYPEGSELSVFAQADSGYEFQGWLHREAENPLHLSVNSDLSLRPYFKEIGNLLTNGNFSIETLEWSSYISDPESNAADFKVLDGKYVIDIINRSGVDWKIGVQQSKIRLSKGYYKISYEASSPSTGKLVTTVARNYGDWGSYLNFRKTITQGPAIYSELIYMPKDDNNCRLFFGAGDFAESLSLDNISLTRIDEVPTRLTLSEHDLHLISGQRHSFDLSLINQFGASMDYDPDSSTWSITPGLGVIDEQGEVYFNGSVYEGYVKILYEGLSDSCFISIQPVSAIELEPEELTIDSIRSFTFEVLAYDTEGKLIQDIPDEAFKFSVSDTVIATINDAGDFQALKSGSSEVDVQLTDYSSTSFVHVDCGKEFVLLDTLESEDWIFDASGFSSFEAKTASRFSGMPLIILDYSFVYEGSLPKLRMNAEYPIFGLPDSAWLEIKTKGIGVMSTFGFETYDSQVHSIEGAAYLQDSYALKGTAAWFAEVEAYPITFQYIDFEFFMDQEDLQPGMTYAGTLAINRILLSYPGHMRIAQEPYEKPLSIAPNEIGELSISPNPAVDKIEVCFPNTYEGKQKRVGIFSLDGRAQFEGSTNDMKLLIDIDHFVSGIYIIRVNSGEALFSKRFIISE